MMDIILKIINAGYRPMIGKKREPNSTIQGEVAPNTGSDSGEKLKGRRQKFFINT
jgi:hypothetical protein